MKTHMKKAVFGITAFLCITTFAFGEVQGMGTMRGSYDAVPQPRLLSPVKETVDMTGKEELEFKWSPHEKGGGFREYYDFRLYKGYNMYENTLILKKQVAPDQYSIRLPASVFEEGAVYTWSLRQVYDTAKSLKSFQSFKVIKK